MDKWKLDATLKIIEIEDRMGTQGWKPGQSSYSSEMTKIFICA